MAKIPITVQGRRVLVDESFKGMSTADQERAVNEIAQSFASEAEAYEWQGRPQSTNIEDRRPGVVQDVLNSAGSGLATGAMGIVGAPGDLLWGMQWLGNRIGNAARTMTGKAPLTAEQEAALNADMKLPIPTSADVRGAVTAATGWKPYEPRTTAGRYAQTAAEFVPGAAAFGIGGGLRGAATAATKFGLVPGLASEAAGQAVANSPLPELEPAARIVGGIAGGALPAAGRRLVTPAPASPARTAAVQTLQREGVTDLTAGQMTGSNKLRYTESELGGTRYADILDAQGEQFTRAALARAGIPAVRATADVMQQGYTRLGNEFNRLAARNVLRADRRFLNDLQTDLQWYAGRVAAPNRAPIIGNYATEIQNALRSGRMSGEAYQSLRSRMASDARSAGDQYVQRTLNDLVESLDDAMERSIGTTNRRDLGAWRQVRRYYRNFLVLERAASGAGEAAALGIISPAQLRAATANVHGRRNYALGRSDFAELARAGEAVMRPMPQSGTAPRAAVRNVVSSVPAIMGAGVGGQFAGGQGALLGGLLGAAAPWAVGRAVLSPMGRSYLSNQLLAPPTARGWNSLAAALAGTTLPYRAE